ncbi:hypothetical protein TWF730_003320 [Orbilia blumenaviensis]|uniref:Uncharacterized protein n=1 Tax=Orbilia blumenaviensis TaxID=1796055 RepID=A0AAV9U5H2_9PEZI
MSKSPTAPSPTAASPTEAKLPVQDPPSGTLGLEFYRIPPVGDPSYRPLHLHDPHIVPYDRRTDPIFRLPSPEVLPALPLITKESTYRRVFTLYEVDIPGESRHTLQTWGDEVFEWMIQTVLHSNYGMLLRPEFDTYYEELLIRNIMNTEQAHYFGTLYGFDDRLQRHSNRNLSYLEIQKFLPDTFYAYIGAVEQTRGKEIALKWLGDLMKPILEYRVTEVTRTWPASSFKRAVKGWKKDVLEGRIHKDFLIEPRYYEIEDFEWMGTVWKSWGNLAEEIVEGMLKNLRRHLRAYVGPSRTIDTPIITCECEWHPSDKVWSYLIYFSFNREVFYVGVHQIRRLAEWQAVWKAVSQVTDDKSEVFKYATWY